jgi:hypothetical protein
MSHGPVYVAKCKDMGIVPNMLAILEENDDIRDTGLQQGKLDGFMRPNPTWTKEGLIDHVIELIVVEDEVHIIASDGLFLEN